MTPLVAVPNVSEGRDRGALDAIGAAFATHADVLHRSEDADHHRAVYFLAGAPGELHLALAAGAAAAAARIDLRRHQGLHPRVGALDVAPVVTVRWSSMFVETWTTSRPGRCRPSARTPGSSARSRAATARASASVAGGASSRL